jgi:hypothetical protein
MLELDWFRLAEVVSKEFGERLMALAAEREEPEEDLIIEFIREGLDG